MRGPAFPVFAVVTVAVIVTGGVGEPVVSVAAGGLAAGLILLVVFSKVFMRGFAAVPAGARAGRARWPGSAPWLTRV